MNRADLIGLIALAIAYFLGASQATTPAQAQGYAVLALMVLVWGIAVGLLARIPIERLYRIGVYTSLRLERAASTIKRLRAQIQAQRNTDNRYHAQAIARRDEQIAALTRERDEAREGVKFWQYQARNGEEDGRLSAAYTEIDLLSRQVAALQVECEGLKRANGRRREDRP
jgi:hypothetical protein